MNRMFALLGGGIVAAGITVAAFAHDGKHAEAKKGESGKEVTIQGELLDTACFTASDGDAKGKDHAECAQKCLGSGVPAAVLPENAKDSNDMRFLLTNPVVLAPYAAQTVKVEGTEYAGKHAIDVKKLSVKDASGAWKEVQLQDEHHKMSGGDAPAGGAAAPAATPAAGPKAADGHSGHQHK